MAQNIHLVTTIVAIMAILKIKYIWILLEHNCCNYGNSETKDTVDSWWHNCCNCGKKQIWIPVTTVVAIMAILKNPGDINCHNYGNFEDKKIYGSLFITIVAIMAILKTKNIRIPFHHNCCNYGNSENDTVDSWWQQLLQLWQLWKKQRWIPITTIVAIMAVLKIAKIASLLTK